MFRRFLVFDDPDEYYTLQIHGCIDVFTPVDNLRRLDHILSTSPYPVYVFLDRRSRLRTLKCLVSFALEGDKLEDAYRKALTCSHSAISKYKRVASRQYLPDAEYIGGMYIGYLSNYRTFLKTITRFSVVRNPKIRLR